MEAVRQRIDVGRLEFTQRIAEEPLYISGDPSRLQQMLSNLLDNATKYTLAGGRIWLSLQADENEAVIRVKDTGIGIEPELLGGVFDLFVQTKHTLDRSSGGMGVGSTSCGQSSNCMAAASRRTAAALAKEASSSLGCRARRPRPRTRLRPRRSQPMAAAT